MLRERIEECIKKTTLNLAGLPSMRNKDIEKLSNVAKKIANVYLERRIIRAPSTISGSSLYLASLLLGYPLTRKQIAKESGRSESALYSALNDLILSEGDILYRRAKGDIRQWMFHHTREEVYQKLLERLRKTCVE